MQAPQGLSTESLWRRAGHADHHLHVEGGGQDVHRRRAAAQKGEERRERKQPGTTTNKQPGNNNNNNTDANTDAHFFGPANELGSTYSGIVPARAGSVGSVTRCTKGVSLLSLQPMLFICVSISASLA